MPGPTNSTLVTFIARRVSLGAVVQESEFEATDAASAWRTANLGVDPLAGQWVEVSAKRDPQQRLDID